MNNKKPILIVIEGHAKSGKNTYADFLIEKFKEKNVSFRDLRKLKTVLPNPKKSKKAFEKKCTKYYNDITELLTTDVRNSIIVKWTRNERIISMFEDRESLDHLLFEDAIYEMYNVITITMLFINYADYIHRSHYMLSEKNNYTIQEFDDITAWYYEEYAGFRTNDKFLEDDDLEELDEEFEEDEEDFYISEEELEDLRQEYLENPYEDFEILVDVFVDFKETQKGLDEVWNHLYPIVCSDTPHEAPHFIYDPSGHIRQKSQEN